MGSALCEHCQAEIAAKTARRRFCSDKCRKAAWTAGREQDLALIEESMTRALERAQGLRRRRAQR